MTLPTQARGPEPAQQNDCTPKPASAHTLERPDLRRWTMPKLAEGANREHGLCTDLSGKAMEHAVRCGDYLNEVKGRLKHGELGPWLAANFEGSDRHARRYMFVARNTPNRTRVSVLSLRGGLDALGSPVERPKPPSAKAPPSADGGNESLAPDLQEEVVEGAVDTETDEAAGAAHAESGSDRASTAAPARAVGGRSSQEPREKCVEAATDAGSTRSNRRHAEPLGGGRARARIFDVPAGDEAALAEAASSLASQARAAWRAGRSAHLLVYCSTVPADRAALVRALPFVPQDEDADEDDPFTEDYGYDEVSRKEQKQKRIERQRLRAWNKAEFSRLCRIIRAKRRISPPRDLKEEYRGVPRSLKHKDGLPGDVMAELLAAEHPEFGITDERSLIDVLSRGR